MKKIYILFFLFLVSSYSFSQSIEGEWLFESIRHENDTTKKNIKPIAEGDFIIINNDGTFSYELKDAKIYRHKDCNSNPK